MIKSTMPISIKDILYRYQRFMYTYFTLIKQIFVLQFKPISRVDKIAFIYVMSRHVYAHMALICISSFLYFNRNFEVRLYCDKKLYVACKLIKFLLHRQMITIHPSIDDNSDPMLQQVVMFTKTENGKSILMDADIRWTDKIQYNFKNPLVYNEEKDLEHQELWKLLSSYLDLDKLEKFTMYTCCITSLGEHQINYMHSELKEILTKIESFNWTNPLLKPIQKHIRGQFIISYVLSKINVPPISVIEIQHQNERKFLETSFYGATGYRYGT